MYQKINSLVLRVLFVSKYRECKGTPTAKCYVVGDLGDPKDFKDVLVNVTNYYGYFNARRAVTERRDQALTRLDAIKNYLLPALFGMLGACTYVVRLISDQIKDFTFSTTSPLRHGLRVALGSIVGILVTYFGLITVNSLSASAISFLAGYAIEPVFSTFDSLVEKFRSDKKS